MPVTVTTNLPDEDQPVLGNGVEDEVSVDRESAVSDYGDVRIQIRETGESSWDSAAEGFAEFIGAYDTLTMEFTGRKDGEEYEVRARTETEHVTGEWTEPVSIITLFPGGQNLFVSPAGQAQIDGTFDDVSDNEVGFEIQRQKWYADIEEWGPWRSVSTLGPNTESFSDDSAQTNTRYRYRIRAYTDYTEAYSDPDTATTESSGAREKNVPPSGWHVEIEHPDADAPLTPEVGEGANPKQTVNGLPRVELPVERDEKWQSEAFNEATMRVWQDGERVPIDTLVDVSMEEDQTVLIGRGGSELLDRVEHEVNFDDAHAVARDLINTTNYTANVDDPATDVDEGAVMFEADETESWTLFLDEIDPTKPLTTDGDELRTTETAPIRSGQSHDVEVEASPLFADRYQGGQAWGIANIGERLEWHDFQFDHDVEPGDAELALRIDYFNGNHPAMRFTVNGETVHYAPPDFDAQGENIRPGWLTASLENGFEAGEQFDVRYELEYYGGSATDTIYIDNAGVGYNLPTATDTDSHPYGQNRNVSNVVVEDGQYTEGEDYEISYGTGKITVLSGGDMAINQEYTISYDYGHDYSHVDGAELLIDAVAVIDTNYTISTVQEDLTDGGSLSWPNVHPDAVTVESVDYQTPFSVVGGGMDLSINNTENEQAIAVSNDQGQTWTEAQNTASLDTDFAQASPQIRGRITLSYYDDGSSVSTLGGGQSIDVAELLADIDDTPTLANRTFDGKLQDVLKKIADDRNFVWEVRWDDENETMSVEWCQPGQRYSDANPSVARYNITKSTENLVEQLTVYGSAQRRRGEMVTLNQGEETDLDHTDLLPLREAVVDSDGNQYTRDEDYEMSYLFGTITPLETGDIADGETVEIDYEYKTQGTWPADDEAPPDARQDTRRIMGLGSSRICEQTAYYIVQRTQDPIWKGSIVLPKQELGWSVVNEINPDKVPTAGNRLEIVLIDETESNIRVDIRSRRTVNELVQDLSSGLEELREVS